MIVELAKIRRTLKTTKINMSRIRVTRQAWRTGYESFKTIYDHAPRLDNKANDCDGEQANERSGECVHEQGHPESLHAFITHRCSGATCEPCRLVAPLSGSAASLI